MIREIIRLLKNVNNETENIKIAKGKNKLATTWNEAYKQIKDSIK